MAIRQVRIGSMNNIHQYDDADYDEAIYTDAPIKAGTPVAATDVLRKGDVSSTTVEAAWPVGSIFLSVSSSNPNTLLGFGTWVRIAEGQFLVGYKSGDVDFGTLEGTGGSKTHTHNVDVTSTTSGAPSSTTEVDNNLDSSTVNVASNNHTHDTDPASVTSGDNNNLQPFFTINVWKRTA